MLFVEATHRMLSHRKARYVYIPTFFLNGISVSILPPTPPPPHLLTLAFFLYPVFLFTNLSLSYSLLPSLFLDPPPSLFLFSTPLFPIVSSLYTLSLPLPLLSSLFLDTKSFIHSSIPYHHAF